MKIAFIPTKLNDFGKALEVFHTKHKPQNLLGISFRPTYKIDQDMFNQLTRTSPLLKIPENLRVIFSGAGKPSVNLEVCENAKFIGKKAVFLDVINSGKKAVLNKVFGILVTEDTALSKVKIAKNTISKDHSRLWANFVLGANHTIDSAKSFVFGVKGMNHTQDKGFSAVGIAMANLTENQAQSLVLNVQRNNTTAGKALSYAHTVKNNNHTVDGAYSFVHLLKGDNFVCDNASCKIKTAEKNCYHEANTRFDIKRLAGETVSVEELHAKDVAKIVGKYTGATLQEFCN